MDTHQFAFEFGQHALAKRFQMLFCFSQSPRVLLFSAKDERDNGIAPVNKLSSATFSHPNPLKCSVTVWNSDTGELTQGARNILIATPTDARDL